jgi:hypothetical protein
MYRLSRSITEDKIYFRYNEQYTPERLVTKLYVPKYKDITLPTHDITITSEEYDECGILSNMFDSWHYESMTIIQLVLQSDGIYTLLTIAYKIYDLEKFVCGIFKRVKKTTLVGNYAIIHIVDTANNKLASFDINQSGVTCKAIEYKYHAIERHIAEKYKTKDMKYMCCNLGETKKMKTYADTKVKLCNKN